MAVDWLLSEAKLVVLLLRVGRMKSSPRETIELRGLSSETISIDLTVLGVARTAAMPAEVMLVVVLLLMLDVLIVLLFMVLLLFAFVGV